jgi:hypothetical protein
MPPWWGAFTLETGEIRRWSMGPLTLWAARLPHEWRVGVKALSDPLHEALEVAAPATEIPSDLTAGWRFATGHEQASLELTPALADRSVVQRPETPLCLVGQDTTELFVSTPVWVVIALGGRKVLEIPTFRPSDTWFGPSPRHGELCYASRTVGRLDVAAMHRRPARALSRVILTNAGPTARRLERLRLPATALSLFAGGGGVLWTTSVEMRLERAGSVSVSVLDAPPPAAAECTRLSGPRVAPEAGLLSKALEFWLS